MKISTDIDRGIYEKGKVVTDEKLEKEDLIWYEVHGNWNYTIGSRKK